MGILLIGVVAALFFRNERLLPEDMPSVNRERELNERLRERDVAVYLNDETSADSGAGIPAPHPEGGHAWTLREFFSELQQRNSGVPAPVGRQPDLSKSESVRQATVPLDSASRFAVPGHSHAQVSDDKKDDSLVVATPSAAEPSSETVAPAGAFDTFPETSANATSTVESANVPAAGTFDEYTVQYGDTLSGIADRFLGSPQKYRELYDANRDRLPSADRLQVGKAIRIPRAMH